MFSLGTALEPGTEDTPTISTFKASCKIGKSSRDSGVVLDTDENGAVHHCFMHQASSQRRSTRLVVRLPWNPGRQEQWTEGL
ncbi:hypothetical protein TWF730_009593 [Orbilia blumenaviensis]|uniref:Uncharacterized protein n=1 Tax=Orbilia blumenaviensis TaxID=1796055 RepID=A0AAV9US55_9PEZI